MYIYQLEVGNKVMTRKMTRKINNELTIQQRTTMNSKIVQEVGYLKLDWALQLIGKQGRSYMNSIRHWL